MLAQVSAAIAFEPRETARPELCAWCRAPIDLTAKRLAGRVVCGTCGVANTDPWPSESDLTAAYANWYRPSSGRFGFGDAVLRKTRGRLARRLDRIAPSGGILDVGAGDGTLLDALTMRGRQALGLEREAHRSDVRSGDLSDIGGRWAAIVFWHSLEHLPNAGEEIDRAASMLLPGGLVVIAVPNATSFQARVFGDRWLALDLPRHLVHLPASALIDRLRSRSLEVQRVSYWRGGQVVFGWLHGFVGALPGELNLYGAIRSGEAREQPQSVPKRLTTLGVAVGLVPAALLAAMIEIAIGRGGTVYVEARHV